MANDNIIEHQYMYPQMLCERVCELITEKWRRHYITNTIACRINTDERQRPGGLDGTNITRVVEESCV